VYRIDNFMCKTCLNLKITMSTVKRIFLRYIQTQMPMVNDDWFLCQRCNNILENPYRVRRRIFIESHRVCSFHFENGLLKTDMGVCNDRVVAVIILFRILCTYTYNRSLEVFTIECHDDYLLLLLYYYYYYTTTTSTMYYILCHWPIIINYNIIIYIIVTCNTMFYNTQILVCSTLLQE